MRQTLRTLFTLFCALVSLSAPGFELSTSTWPGATTTFHVSIPGADGLWNTSFEDAMAVWNETGAFEYRIFRSSFVDPCGEPTDVGFPANGVKFGTTACGDSWGSTTLAISFLWFDTLVGGNMVQSGIVFNSNESWDVYNGPMQAFTSDFRRTAIHELGHALGLDHEDDVPAIMNSTVGDIESLTSDDLAGLGALYPGGDPVDAGQWRTINGTLNFNDTPICALVLANGQHMFSCAGAGEFALTAPLDANGEITLFVFANGFAPVRLTRRPEEFQDLTLELTRPIRSRELTVDYTASPVTQDRIEISGTVMSGATPVCGLILANGQHMFSCGASQGIINLDNVPKDAQGKVRLFAFASGFPPFVVDF